MIASPPAIGPSPIQRVLLCDRLTRGSLGRPSVGRSLPGHLIQLTTRGVADHAINGRRYSIGRRDLVWFHEDETVETEVRSAPWVFFTVNFVAPALSPPPFERRVIRVGPRAPGAFATCSRPGGTRRVPRSSARPGCTRACCG